MLGEREYTYKIEEDSISEVNEPGSSMRFYGSQEEQELERLKESMNRSATEKFRVLMGMMKVGNMMRKAVIHHKD